MYNYRIMMNDMNIDRYTKNIDFATYNYEDKNDKKLLKCLCGGYTQNNKSSIKIHMSK